MAISLPVVVSCGGDDASSSNGGGSLGIVDGVHVNPRKLLALDVHKGESDNTNIHFDISYDAKGRLSNIVAKIPSNSTMQPDVRKMVSIDYDLRVIEYWKQDDITYNPTTQKYEYTPYERVFFNLNNRGFISTLSNCELSYNNDGFLVGAKSIRDMWTFAYGESDVIKFMVENLKKGNIDIFYTHYGQKEGDMYFAVNNPSKLGSPYLTYSNYRAISLLILYQAGLFGNISRQCVQLSDSSNKNAIVEQISDVDKKSQIIRCSFVFG